MRELVVDVSTSREGICNGQGRLHEYRSEDGGVAVAVVAVVATTGGTGELLQHFLCLDLNVIRPGFHNGGERG